jgi:N-acylglucosamine-6-phosphate 2-epimerase
MPNTIFSSFQQKLIVSCQALADEPLFGANIMAALARAALMGGAAGIRANTPVDIAAIRAVVDLPIIGLYKAVLAGYQDVYITPTVQHALEVSQAGADIIALDATARPHPEGLDAAGLIQAVRAATHKPVLADISTFEEGVAAYEAGADAVSTTLSGYTPYSPQQVEPDLDLVERLAYQIPIPVIAEGRIITPEQACLALERGAYSVVVGGAITRPQWITQHFVRGMRGAKC